MSVAFDNSQHNVSWETDLETWILQACIGEQPNASGAPSHIQRALEKSARLSSERAENLLSRTVDWSMNSSEAMASVAKTTTVIREVDSLSHDMSSAIEELTASIGQVAHSAEGANDVLERCLDLSRSSAASSEKTTKSMQTVSDSVSSASERVDELASASQQIGSIVDTISQIANQTNLLALNATIEAARAGESGRGFAVAASEVKQLSTQTARATDDIRNRIDTLQKEVDAILSAMAASTTAVREGTAACDETTQTTHAVMYEIQKGNEATAEIASILSEQRAATEELAVGVTKVAASASVAERRVEDVVSSVSSMESMIGEQFTELERTEIKDYVLYRAKSDHFLWKKNLSGMIAGLNSLKPEELSDHSKCRLGKWYSLQSSSDMRSLSPFRELEKPHAEVHSHGKLAAQKFQAGDREGAEAAIADMETASDQVVDLLNQIIRR